MSAGARILAIDDQLYFRSFIESLLAGEGHAVATAESGAAALARIEEDGPFDVVVMDLVGPERDGVETVEELRRRWPDQDVIVVTSVGDVRSVVAAMKRGAADYLLKPIDREGLLRAVDGVLEGRRMRAENARLVDENLSFMGRLSLVERAVALLRLRDPAETGRALLEQLRIEADAGAAALWMRQAEGGALRLVASAGAAGALPQDAAPDEEDRSIREGRIGPAGEGALWIPCCAGGELLAVARLWELGSPLAPTETEACAKLAEIGAMAIANSLEREALRHAGFRDPVTGLLTRAFIDEVARTEVHKAHRYGRGLCLLCIDLEGLDPDAPPDVLRRLVSVMARSLRTTDILVSDGRRRYWILLTDADPVGGVVLKRRIGERLVAEIRELGLAASTALGVASYPGDGESLELLREAAVARVRLERASIAHELGIRPESPLSEISRRLLARAVPLPQGFVADAADLLVSELTCRPRDRGLLFFAPGVDAKAFFGPLAALGDSDSATEVFLATDGDTLPAGPALTALALPPDVPLGTTWIVRFGEAPPYALVAGPADAQADTRPVFHSTDPVLVEHVTFRLRAEIGLGLRA